MIQKSSYEAPSVELVEVLIDGALLKASEKSSNVELAIYLGSEDWD